MPISDPDGYEKGHFERVYHHLIKEPCEELGLKAKRADEVKGTNLIHLDIVSSIVESDIAICDLSSRNPNVFFELGVRQSFDKPVILIQEAGTPRVFDISPLRVHDYNKSLRYPEVKAFQELLKGAIKETLQPDQSKDVNSIVRLLSVSAASIPSLSEENKEGIEFQVIRGELRELRDIVVGGTGRSPQVASSLEKCISRLLAAIQAFLGKEGQLTNSERELLLGMLEKIARLDVLSLRLEAKKLILALHHSPNADEALDL